MTQQLNCNNKYKIMQDKRHDRYLLSLYAYKYNHVIIKLLYIVLQVKLFQAVSNITRTVSTIHTFLIQRTVTIKTNVEVFRDKNVSEVAILAGL